MDTTTLLAVVGGFVAVKTLTIVVLVTRRDRRQRRRLDVAVTAARRADPFGWRLQWTEPGVLLVASSEHGASARDVELTATLTARSGVTASVQRATRFVGTGASVELRFVDLEEWLSEVATTSWAASEHSCREARERLGCTLTYSIRWVDEDGEQRYESRTAQPVLPVPDLALGSA